MTAAVYCAINEGYFHLKRGISSLAKIMYSSKLPIILVKSTGDWNSKYVKLKMRLNGRDVKEAY